VRLMRWETKIRPPEMTPGILPVQLSAPEQRILDLLKERAQMHIDLINSVSGFSNSLNANVLLELEMKDLICSIPGRMYKLKSL